MIAAISKNRKTGAGPSGRWRRRTLATQHTRNARYASAVSASPLNTRALIAANGLFGWMLSLAIGGAGCLQIKLAAS